MQVAFTLSWWVLPTIVTVLAIAWAFFWPADRGGMFGELETVFMLVPALLLTAIVWIVAAIFK